MRKDEYTKIASALATFDCENKKDNKDAIHVIFESLHGAENSQSYNDKYSLLLEMWGVYESTMQAFDNSKKTPIQLAQEKELAGLHK